MQGMQGRNPHFVRAWLPCAAIVTALTSVVGPDARAGVPLDDPIPAPLAPGLIHVRLAPIATGLTAPNWGIDAPGQPDRLFVVDQNGIVWAIDLVTLQKSVFLDVSALLVPLGIAGPGTYDERGLLGLAFHPDYATNGLLYVYTSQPANQPPDFSTMPLMVLPDHQDVVTEWHVPNPTNAASVPDPSSARVLFRNDHPQFNHDGGAMQFGPDGLLYISIGDGGQGDDEGIGHAPEGNGQNLDTVMGKILRIDPLGNNSANGKYGIPVDNPFVGATPGLDEIYAYGFRNPFRFSFESGGKQELYVADVGQNDIEELDIVGPGENHGWPVKEGTFLFDGNGRDAGFVFADSPGAPANMVDPIAQYDHDEGIATIGGFVYEGTKVPALQGRFVFGDFLDPGAGVGRLFHVPEDGGTVEEFNLVGQESLGLALLGFGRDAHGEIYVLANFTQIPFGTTGVVMRIELLSGDLNADGHVDGADLGLLLGSWGPCGKGACPADLNGDGVVDGADLGIVLGAWTG